MVYNTQIENLRRSVSGLSSDLRFVKSKVDDLERRLSDEIHNRHRLEDQVAALSRKVDGLGKGNH